MPIFFGAILSWFGVSIGQAAKDITLRIVLTAAFVVASLVSIGILIAATIMVLDGISTTVPSIAADVWSWFMPPNAGECITSLVVVRFARAVHDYRIMILKMKASAR